MANEPFVQYKVTDSLGRQVNLVDIIYPIGSIYWSSSSTYPGDLFGGEWTQIEGRFVIAAGKGTDSNSVSRTFVVDTTGGEYSHKLASYEAPKHLHDYRDTIWTENMTNKGNADGLFTYGLPMPGSDEGCDYDNKNSAYLNRRTESSLGSGVVLGNCEPHNNMPPYVVKYCWERTA